jgi:hypothetical protein
MKQTVVGVFDRIDAARQAADRLGVSGFGEGSVHVSAASGQQAELAGLASTDTRPEDNDVGVMSSLRSFFAEVFGPGEWSHHQEYAEAVRRGAVVVKVEVHDEARLDIARETLQSAGAIDIEERVAEWREDGWTAGNDLPGARPLTDGAPAGAAQPLASASAPATRAAGRSRVRVYSHGGTGAGAAAPSGGPSPEQRVLELGELDLPEAGDAAPRVDALELLSADHRKVRQLFGDYGDLAENKAPAEQRERLAENICVQLTIHAALEEEIFYPAARAALMPTDLVDEASVEHASARELIERIRAMDGEDELYDATVRVLGEYIDHHVREEEDQLFPAVRGTSLDLAELGLEMSDRKAELLAQFDKETKLR